MREEYWVRQRFVLDTNTLIYAAETWDEGYRRAVEWARVKEARPRGFLAGRRYGEAVARHVLDLCALGEAECVVPEVVVHEVELTGEEDLRSRALELVALAKVRVVRGLDISELYRLVPHELQHEVRRVVESARRRGEKVGLPMSADPYLLLLALKKGYTLVTTDRKLADLAQRLGIDVVYPVARRVKVGEAKYRPRPAITPTFTRTPRLAR